MAEDIGMESMIGGRYAHEPRDGSDGSECRTNLYRDHAVDIHSHILPGVDDGAQTLDEARELACLDREEGIEVVFATPHYGWENGYAPDRNHVLKHWNAVLDAMHREQGECLKPSVCLGTEWYCADSIVDRIMNREAFPMGNSGWYMVEFLEYGNVSEPADVMLYRLAKMKAAGIHTILAHPERYKAIQQDWNLAKRICDLGVLLQVNAFDLSLNKSAATLDLAQWMAQERLISFLGSDMHGTREGSRKPRMKEGIRWLYEHTEEEYANDVVRRNAEKYLGIPKLSAV